MLRRLRVTIEGRAYDVTVEDLTSSDNSLYPAPGTMAAGSSPAMAASPTTEPGPSSTPPPASAVAVPPATGGPAGGPGAVVSSMSGVVVEVLVRVGESVAAGDTVAIIEAMKMKTPLVVNEGGTVSSIELSVGDTVLAGQTVLTLG